MSQTGSSKGLIRNLPLKIILTENGINFFIKHNKKLNRFKMADEVEEYGIFLDNFSPGSLQRMCLIEYIAKIEIARVEFVSKRQELMDLTKLLVFGILYKQLDAAIFKKVLNSNLIKNWNRNNPSNIIDEKTNINESYLEKILKKNEEQIQAVKRGILSPILARINNDSNLLPEEKKIKYFICEKFLNNLRPSIWFILSRFQASKDYLLLLTEIREGVLEYLEKTIIAEYLSLMVMELVINAENTNMQKFVTRVYKNSINLESLVYDQNIRNQILNEMISKNELLFLTWKIGGKSSSISTRNKLQVILYNKESEYRSIKQSIEDKKGINLRKKSLTDFYKEAPDSLVNTELGLYYLSYLSEACEKVNVRFDSIVNQIQKSDLTVITLNLYF
ncbi:MAG: hypothetical protein JW969_03005 [Spirochaetales bacterium]|nr:hypothetical protein [Spirochaetales bacterium]